MTGFVMPDVQLPRLWTPPLRELTPETSYGFSVIDFARDVLEEPLDPWQEWLVVHAGELLEDGRPRFRTVLAIVARQNGKTHLLRVLIMYWLFVEQVGLVLGTSTTRDYAKEVWTQVCDSSAGNRWLAGLSDPPIRGTGLETFRTKSGSKYRIAASNRSGGRGLTVDRLAIDELREHQTWDAWNASTYAQNAVWDAQAWTISNMGDEKSVVLNSLRQAGLSFIETGEGDPRFGLFEWSVPSGEDLTDPNVLVRANPNLGRRTDVDAAVGAARRAIAAGGAELAGFRTEVACQQVLLLDPAIDPDAWTRCTDPEPLDLAEHRRRTSLFLDVSIDGNHATLVAAVNLDGTVHVEVVKQWSGYGCTALVREDLPGLLRRVNPRNIGWYPQSGAAAITVELNKKSWIPQGTKAAPITSEMTAVCMGFADLVRTGKLRHPGDQMLNQHVFSSEKLRRGDGFVFTRTGTHQVDGSYAAAGAVHLARSTPEHTPLVIA